MSSDVIEVKVLVTGKPSTEFALDGDAKLSDLRVALRNSDNMADVAGAKFQRNGSLISDETTLSDGDRLTIYTKVEGGLL